MAEMKQNYPTKGGSEYKPDAYEGGGIATAVKDKAKDLASQAGDMATQAKEKVQDWASTAAGKAGDAKSSVGGSMESLAGKIREKAPAEGMFGSAASEVADTVEAAGSYLRDSDFADIGEDVTNVIRRYPIPSILIGIGLGFLLARATRS